MNKAIAFLILTAVVCAPAYGAPRVETLQSTSEVLEFIVHFGTPTLEEFESEGRQYSRVRLDGLFSGAMPGEPELPTYGVNFAVPAGTRAELEFDAQNIRSYQGLTPRPMPKVSIEPGDAMPLQKVKFELDSSSYQADLWPGSQVVLSEPVSWRYQTMQTARLWPVRVDPQTGRYTSARAIRVQVKFVPDGSSAFGRVPSGPDHPGVQALSNQLMLNGEQAVHWRTQPAKPSRVLQPASADEGQVRILFGGVGLARVSFAELAQAGFPADVAVEDVTVQERGFNDKSGGNPYTRRTVSRLVEDKNQNGVFDQGDFLFFYGEDFHTRYNPRVWVARYTYFHAYWVCEEPDGGRDFGQRGELTGPFTPVANFRKKLRVERDLIYRDSQPGVGGFFPMTSPLYWFDERAHINTVPLRCPRLGPGGHSEAHREVAGYVDQPHQLE